MLRAGIETRALVSVPVAPIFCALLSFTSALPPNIQRQEVRDQISAASTASPMPRMAGKEQGLGKTK